MRRRSLLDHHYEPIGRNRDLDRQDGSAVGVERSGHYNVAGKTVQIDLDRLRSIPEVHDHAGAAITAGVKQVRNRIANIWAAAFFRRSDGVVERQSGQGCFDRTILSRCGKSRGWSKRDEREGGSIFCAAEPKESQDASQSIMYSSPDISESTRDFTNLCYTCQMNPEEPAGSEGLSERAYRRVRDRILKGEYTFGTIISRRDLANELGMSLVPVNEAMSRLENEYLIENTPRVGTKVKTPTPQDIRGFWAVREGLETQSARLFARMATKKERGELIGLGKALDVKHESTTSSEEPEPQALYEWRCLHMRYHTRIAECTKLPFLAQQIERNQLLVFNWFYDQQLYGGRKLPPRWHEQLAQSLADGSEEEADAAMRRHLHNKLEELMLSLERFLLMDESHLLRWTTGVQQAVDDIMLTDGGKP